MEISATENTKTSKVHHFAFIGIMRITMHIHEFEKHRYEGKLFLHENKNL